MNKTKITIKHSKGMFRFETKCRSTYDSRMWRLLVSEWMPSCDGETLLTLLDKEELRVQQKIEEVDKIWLEQNSLPLNVTVADMQDFIAKRIILQKSGKKLIIKYTDSASARYIVETVTDARSAVAGITTVFKSPDCPATTSVLIPHLVRQRVFELLNGAKMLGVARIFDTAVFGRSGTVA